MDYLGYSIVDEAGTGTGSRIIPNKFTKDKAAIQTVLPNHKPSSSLYPYVYFTDQSATFVLGDNSTLNTSGNVDINYRGTYTFQMIGSWYGDIQPVYTDPQPQPIFPNIVINSFTFKAVIGTNPICVLPPLLLQNDVFTITRSDPLIIEISGTMDVLSDPGNNTLIQTVMKYKLYTSTFQNFGITENTSTIDILPTEHNFSIDVTVVEISSTVPTSINFIFFTRRTANVQCLCSD